MPAPPPLVPDRTRRDWTVEELHALPDDGNRYEIVDGELLVTPAPSWRHQACVLELALLVEPYARAHQLWTLIARAEVEFSERRVVEPDLFVVPVAEGKRAERFADVGELVLAVEVVSPSSARADRYVKRRLYLSERVAEYWIVDAANRLVERWRPGDEEPEVVIETLAWAPRAGVEALVVDLAAFFGRVQG